MNEKRCPECEKTYPPTEQYFGIDRSRSSGLSIYCMQCKRKRATEGRRRRLAGEVIRKPAAASSVEVAELHKQGWTFQRIGQHFGISRQRVHQLYQQRAEDP